jgi:S1-C subfamily serine protease
VIHGPPDEPDEVDMPGYPAEGPSGRTVVVLALVTLAVVLGLGGLAVWVTFPGRGTQASPREGRSTVAAPDSALLRRPEVRAAERSVVKLVGTAPECRRRIQSTGFAYAPERVMTNAHSVAGSQGPIDVQVPSTGAHYSATVVLFDPRRDVAVLVVPELRLAGLAFDPAGAPDVPAVIAGFPKDAGSVTATAARIRARQTSVGADIYHSAQNIRRAVFWVSGTVQPGDSGAPLLSATGSVYGLVFAAAYDDPGGGYALTADEIADDAQAGRIATDAVTTGACI